MKVFLFAAFLFLQFTIANSKLPDRTQLDSLLNLYHDNDLESNTSDYYNLIFEIGKRYRHINPDSAEYYINNYVNNTTSRYLKSKGFYSLSLYAKDKRDFIKQDSLNSLIISMLSKDSLRHLNPIAKAYKATATIEIQKGLPITFNHKELTEEMLPTLQRFAGKKNVNEISAVTGAEDFSFYQQKIPGLYFFLGAKSLDIKQQDATGHHTPDFMLDESGFVLGVKTMTALALDYLRN